MHMSSGRVIAIVSTLVLSLGAAAPALVQNRAGHEGGIGVGANVGFTTNSVHGTDISGAFKSRTGALFGLWVGGNKGGLIGFTGEFNYIMGGFKDADGNDIKQNIVEIPTVFHINIGSRRRNGVAGFILAGPVFDINLKSKIGDVDVTDNFNGFSEGVMAGAGIEAYRVGVQVRGNWGLVNVAKNFADMSDVKTRSIQIVGTVRFN
jgi:hypothetical protein